MLERPHVAFDLFYPLLPKIVDPNRSLTHVIYRIDLGIGGFRRRRCGESQRCNRCRPLRYPVAPIQFGAFESCALARGVSRRFALSRLEITSGLCAILVSTL